MKSYLLILLPLAIFLLWVIRRAPKSSSSSTARPDFIAQAADSIHGPEVVVASSPSESAPDGVDYNYDVVGRAFREIT